jgi:pimeloyl-ACP methyl ester carboxylesterase
MRGDDLERFMIADDQMRLLQPADVPAVTLRRAQERVGFEQEYPFESCWFRTADGIQHYIDVGSGPVLLMVHGNPTWSFVWRNLARDLSQQYRVIAIDHLGCGFSDSPQNRSLYTLDGHIRRLQALVQLLDLRQVTLFAHDWGGAIGMGCAGREHSRFSRFVLMITGAFRSRAIPLRIAVCRIPLLGRLANQAFGLFARAALRMAAEKPLSAAVRAGLMAPWSSWERRLAMQEFVLDIPLGPEHRSYAALTAVEEGLRKFRDHPVKLIWGMRDWCFTPEEFLAGFEQRFPAADVCRLAEAGHYVFEDAAERVLAESLRFLESNSLPTTV